MISYVLFLWSCAFLMLSLMSEQYPVVPLWIILMADAAYTVAVTESRK